MSYMKPSYLQESMSFENHAQLVKGKPVDGGYTLKFNSNGELVKYNHYSGHYETPEDRISLLEYLFKISGVDMTKAQKVGLDDPDIGDPAIF